MFRASSQSEKSQAFSNVRNSSGMLLGAMILGAITGWSGGCSSMQSLHSASVTIFVDGAGNLGHGASDLKEGFAAAGFETSVEEFIWSPTFNPLLDQLNVKAAHRKADSLAERIRTIRRNNPESQLNLVAFSAGTGVAVWACEQLDATATVDNLVLFGSSLSHDYDLTRAAANVRDNVVAFHSPKDAVLKLVRVVGTIDGKRGVAAGGLVGFSCGLRGKVVNVPWRPQWAPMGWNGGHSDSTAPGLVQGVLVGLLTSDPSEVVRAQLLEPESLPMAANGTVATIGL